MQIQVCRDAQCSVIQFLLRNGHEDLTVLTAMELAHALNQFILDDRNHRTDAEVGHFQWRIDGITQTHDGNVEIVWCAAHHGKGLSWW